MSQRFSGTTSINASSFALNPAAGWTVCGWLYVVSSAPGSDGDLFEVEPSANPGTARAIRLGYNNNGSAPTVRFRVGNGTDQLNATPTIAPGDWNHLALTFDGDDARAYIDGQEVAAAVILGMSGSYDTVRIGSFTSGAVVELAQVKVWQGVALTQQQIATEMLYWRPQTAPANLYAWWQLDAAAPTLDSSGHSRTLSGPGTANGSFTPPGQLDPVNQNVAAVGGTLSNGVAVIRTKLRVSAAGATVSNGSAWLSTSVPTIGGGASALGGRARKKRGRR